MPSHRSVRYSRLQQSELSHGRSVDSKSSKKWHLIWRGINFLMVIFFLLSAYVQINDPDPYIWIPVYLLPALLSIGITVKPDITLNVIWKVVCTVHIFLCLAGAIYLLIVVLSLFSQYRDNPLRHEEGREFAGLVITIVWLCVCRFTSFGSSDQSSMSSNMLLLLTGCTAFLPLVVWSLCFIKGLESLGHCNDMFPGMLGSG